MERDPFRPRQKEENLRILRTLMVAAIAIVVIAGIAALLTPRTKSSYDMPTTESSPGSVSAEVQLTKWYVIDRLTAQWVKQDREDGELSDIYEVKGQVRKKYDDVPEVATIIVKQHVGNLDVAQKAAIVRDITVNEGKAFTVEIADPTLARARGNDVTMLISAHPGS